jgi:polyisoprenoid-binding protein YceI
MQPGTQRGLAPVQYLIDPAASRFTAQAFATGLLSAFGHNPTIGIRDYEGQIQFVPDSYEKSFVRLLVQTGAMEVLDEMKNDDRKKLEQVMFDEVLNVKLFPTAVFESKDITVQKLDNSALLQAQVMGDLAFHGMTQTNSFDARITPMGDMMRISGEFPLRLSHYGIKPVSFAAGALRLKDEVKFKFEMVARRQE